MKFRTTIAAVALGASLTTGTLFVNTAHAESNGGNLDGVLDYLARTTKEGSNQEEEGERKRDGDSVLL